MENTLYIALSRQVGLWNKLDMTANNLANMNTAGYKAVSPHFTEYVSRSQNDERLMPHRLSFTHDFGIVRNFAEGAFEPTDNPLDVAIHGDGYFAVDTPEGVLYTRDGQFKIGQDGMIVTANGYAVLDDAGRPMFVSPDETKININQDGTIETENGVIGKFQLVAFADPQRLRSVRHGLYRNPEGNAVRPASVQTEQGMIEKSNVNAVVEMSEMIKVQRAYENVQMMLDTEHTRRQNMMQVYARAK